MFLVYEIFILIIPVYKESKCNYKSRKDYQCYYFYFLFFNAPFSLIQAHIETEFTHRSHISTELHTGFTIPASDMSTHCLSREEL